MKFNSITFKLLSFIIGTFVVTTVSVMVLSNIQLTRIIDRSQNVMYAEKVDAILTTLGRSDDRLKKTGLVEAYADDFRRSALKALRQTYYKQPDQPIYPFILDADGRVVMHPVLPSGDQSLKKTKVAQKMLSSYKGDFGYIYHGQKKWCIYKRFSEWDWVIGYTVPLEIKYGDVRMFRNILVLIMGGITTLVLLVLSLIVAQFTKPIIRLTNISTQIAGGNLNQQIDLGSKDEVGTLARSFARMRDATKKQIAALNLEIRERRQVEEELRHLRNYLSNIIDSMPSVLVGVDMHGKVTQWNKTAELTTGITACTAHGKTLSDVFPRMAKKMEKINKSIQTREIQQELKKPRLSDNETFYEDMTIYPLIANGVEGAVIRIDDVTDKVRMEEMMIQSEKMLSVGGLAAGMAHEINNPLAGMMQTAEVMTSRLTRADMPANLKAAETAGTNIEAIKNYMEARGILRMLTTINESGKRMADIVNNMLSFSRKSDSAVSSHDLADLLDKTLELAATDYDLKKHYDFKMITIRKEYEDNLPYIPCEGAKIQQVLLNILRNGAEAMQEAGTEKPRFIFRAYFEKKQQTICMEIEDNGQGMDEETRKRVFEPFYTTKPVGLGTGLGLSVSYFIITENHGGEMGVESRPGLGAKFIIRLPVQNT